MNTDAHLRDLFAERGESVEVAVPDLADRAINRDRSNRRRETALAAAGGVLALALVVPVGWSALDRSAVAPVPGGPTSRSVTGTPSSTSPTPAPTTPETPAHTRAGTAPSTPSAPRTLQGTDAGNAPIVRAATGGPTATTEHGYVVDGVYHEGSVSITLPKNLPNVSAVSRLGDGLIVTSDAGVSIVDRRGATVITSAAFDAFVVAPDRAHAVIKNAKSGNLDYVDAAGTSLRALGNPGGPGYRAVGIVGTTVYAVDGAETSTLAWDVATDRTTTLKGAVNLLNAATNRALVHVPGSVSGDGDTYCNDLVDLSSGQQLWRFCGPLRFTGFSPDGAYLMAAGEVDGLDPSRTTGEYPDLVVMRTDTMDIVLRSAGTVTQPGPAGFSAAALTVDSSVLTVVTASGARSLQTCVLSTGACQVVEASAGRYLISGN